MHGILKSCGSAIYLKNTKLPCIEPRLSGEGGGAVAQSVERATPGEEVPGSTSAVAARSLLGGSVSVYYDPLRQKSWSPRSVSCVAAFKIVIRDISLVADEDFQNPNKQTKLLPLEFFLSKLKYWVGLGKIAL